MTTAVAERATEASTSSNTFYVHGITYEARDVLVFDLRPAGGSIAAFEPGAHIDVVLPNGVVRQYSLVNEPSVRDRYMICVKHDPNSRGGSRFMHEQLRVGATIDVRAVRNNFLLASDSAPTTLLIAGGIGVTPIVAMAEHLAAEGHPAEVVYAARSRHDLAFLGRLNEAASQLTVHVDDEAGRVLDVDPIVSAAPDDAHLYCCGPAPLLAAFLASTGARAPHRVHFERFAVAAVPTLKKGAFTVELARSGRSLPVAENESILQALRTAGITAASSCEEGICGTCEVRVIAGTPDHRDGILSASERQANRSMMICCSRSIGERLVLDL
jgi:tetrachlorobenzoquinone reductase